MSGATRDAFGNSTKAGTGSILFTSYTALTDVTVAQNDDDFYQGSLRSTAQDAEATFPINPLKPGTWSFVLPCEVGPDKGIASIYIGANKVAEVDMYAATAAKAFASSPQVKMYDGISDTLTVKMESKNPSSSGFGMKISHVDPVRHGA